MHDYYPFGMIARSEAEVIYRFGYQHQEKDDELMGGTYAFTYRIHDPRTIRFFSVDPLVSSFPWNSSYAFAENRLIGAIELEGLEAVDLNTNQTDNTLSGNNLETYQNNKDHAPWKDLISFKPAQSTFDAADKRVAWLSPQPIDEAYSDQLNLDYYSLSISSLPTGFKTSEEFFSYVRTNFSQFTSGSGTTFGEYNSTEGALFNSDDPLSAIMAFQVNTPFRNADDLSVLTSKVENNYWVFSPVFTFRDLGHPVSGNRQFGLTANENGSYTFFTRGADRPWGGLDAKRLKYCLLKTAFG